MYLPQPHNTVSFIGRQEPEAIDFTPKVLSTVPTWEKIVNVVHHIFGHGTVASERHRRVTLNSCIDHQGVKELPEAARIASKLRLRTSTASILGGCGLKWAIDCVQLVHLGITNKIFRIMKQWETRKIPNTTLQNNLLCNYIGIFRKMRLVSSYIIDTSTRRP